ncbi:hypothetical protein BZG36_00876 [Bifiguratus adelaidae]|uniref:Uncharacterized protein n=1 Tax=Bifiguratus adelaidae TaxID=1938954 RepID=A0A261Y5C7_9FUNG|nr:hypothetical protein BZG36_00876 [Bifiguratus adelaidae]
MGRVYKPKHAVGHSITTKPGTRTPKAPKEQVKMTKRGRVEKKGKGVDRKGQRYKNEAITEQLDNVLDELKDQLVQKKTKAQKRAETMHQKALAEQHLQEAEQQHQQLNQDLENALTAMNEL